MKDYMLFTLIGSGVGGGGSWTSWLGNNVLLTKTITYNIYRPIAVPSLI